MKKQTYLKSIYRLFLVSLCLMSVGVGNVWGGNRRVYCYWGYVDWWDNDGCKMCLHAWGSSTLDAADFEMEATDIDKLLYYDLDESYTSLCFFRGSTVDVSKKSNQTVDITIGTNNRWDIWSSTSGDNQNVAAQRWVNGAAIDGLLDPLNPHTQAFNEDGEFSVSLTANTAYEFKVLDNITLYGCGTRDYDYTYVGQTDSVLINTSSGNKVMLLTATGGTYTFGWCSSTKKLKITYPDAPVKHPNMDYVYMEKYSGWNSGKSCNIHYWYTDGSGDHALTSNGEDPKITTGTPVKHEWTGLAYDTAFYTFPVLTDYPKFKAADNASGGTGTNHTSDDGMVTTGHEGHYVYYSDGWKWHTIQIYIQLENAGADEGKKGTLGWNVAFNDTALTAKINLPQKSHYDFGGYYTGEGGTGTQIIDATGAWKTGETDYFNASGAWIHAGDTTKLYAKWTKHPYAIDLAVTPNHIEASDPATGGTIQIGGEDKTSMNAYQDSASVDIHAVPAPGYKFKEWQFSKTGEVYDVYATSDSYSSISNPIKIRAGHTGTLTAVFEPRFSLVGNKYDNTGNGGMPGWDESVYDDSNAFFTVNSTSPVNLTCTCTLDANTRYKFQVHDRYVGTNLGAGTDGKYELLDRAYVDMVNQDKDVTFTTTVEQRYIFHIYGILENDRPRLEILWPRKVNFGWKYANADAMSTLNEGGGGTVTAYVHEGATKTSISNNGWMMNGDSISFTAHPYNDYQLAGWWNDYSFSNKTNMNGDSVHWTVTTEDAKLYAKFVEKTDTLKSGTTWSTDANWSRGSQPTADIVAVIKSPVEVDITDAKAKKVLIMKNSTNTGQLEIPAGKELVVRTTIKKTTDGSTYGATGYDDIIIGSTLANGNGALVMGAHDGTNKATVYFATKAKTTGEGENKHNVNQFIGTPFNDENDILYDYYGTKIYEFKAAHDGDKGTYNEWQRVASTGQKMNGFFGYNILTNQTESPVLEMTGQLSRTNTTETIDGYYNGSSNTENMFANSWVAPIYIPNFKDTCFVNIEKTIYIFNAGTPKDQEGHAMGEGTAETEAAGQYSVLPANSSVYTGLKVIPSMQAFSVFAKGENPKLKFDYNELVYNPSNGTAGIVANRAPQRTNDEDAPNVLRLAATGESGYAAKIVLLERTDFTDGYDDGWDGRFLAGDDAAPQLYAVTSDGNMAINCVPEVEGTVLGFKAGEADEVFTFSFDYDGEALYLYDTQTQTYTRVLTGNTYTFTTNDLAAHNRFILTYNAPQTPTGVENTQELKTVKFIENDHLYIFQNGRLYDAAGRIVK